MTPTVPGFVPHHIRVKTEHRTARAGCSCGWRGATVHSGNNPIGKAAREFHNHQIAAHAAAQAKRGAA